MDGNRRDYDNARYNRRRKQLVALLGGSCTRCEATEDLQFDHIDPKTKSFAISRGMFKPWQALLDEAAKCQLLCKACHIEKTSANGDITSGGHNKIEEHGTEAYFMRMGCRCEPCVIARHDARVRRGDISGERKRRGTYRKGASSSG